jgi:hypothetical protein
MLIQGKCLGLRLIELRAKGFAELRLHKCKPCNDITFTDGAVSNLEQAASDAALSEFDTAVAHVPQMKWISSPVFYLRPWKKFTVLSCIRHQWLGL